MTSRDLSPAEMNELGRNVIASGDLDQAAAIFELLIDAGLAEAQGIVALGIALHDAGRTMDALAWIGRAVSLEPDNPTTFHVLAHLFIAVQAYAEGAGAAQQALVLRPGFTAALAQLGHCLQKLGRAGEAVDSLEQALALDPSDAAARLDLGNAYQDLEDWERAEASFRRAAKDDPASSKPHFNLGNLLQKRGRFQEALAAYDCAMAIAPDDAAVRVNAGLLQLKLEDFERGWANFEWRWQAPSERPVVRTCAAPLWRGGSEIKGKRLLIQSEQGLGDTLQFIRYASLLAREDIEVWVDAPTSLRALLATADGVARVISPEEDLQSVDYRCPMMSLPLALGHFEPLPADANGYLKVSPDARGKWRGRLEVSDRPLVGLAYAGNPNHTNDANRSIDLSLLLKGLPRGPRYLVLQTELRDGDLACLSERDDVEWLGAEFNDFMDTAAVMTCLHRMVTVDTSIAHLAGALGRPTHLLLPFDPDWRWALNRSTCLWYPSVTLHRQEGRGDWSDPLISVSRALEGLVDVHALTGGDPAEIIGSLRPSA